MKLILNGNWKFVQVGKDKEYTGLVPGDVTADLFREGVIEDPYFGMNTQKLEWIHRSDFTYTKKFDVADELLRQDKLFLCFDGIDTFSDITLNGVSLGRTNDMFLKYRFDVKSILKSKENELRVTLHSVLNEMDKIDCSDYFGVFNVPRLFIRKAQCHFGWDWAPNLPGYGIWQDVYVESEPLYKIDETNVWTKIDGNVTFFANLNYNIRRENYEAFAKSDFIRVAVQGEESYVEQIPVTGAKNFVTVKIPQPKLWWPNGYGDPYLYSYTIQLLRDGKVLDEKSGRFGIREVELLEEPIGKDRFTFRFRINKRDVFVRGSNWVPIDCFTGTIEDDKYRKLITLAKAGNLNMLRVWGGGIYEKEIFYDLCDEQGIMVWQDFMYACADIPEDDPEFVALSMKECEQQIKRLRLHSSIVYWCGGNEKTGSCGLMISRGDHFVDVMLRGLVNHLDRTRPYVRQSPYSLTDVGNDTTSGESHSGCIERSYSEGYDTFRKNVAESFVPFSSECAVLGSCIGANYRKFMPNDKLWPPNEVWEDRFCDNPYATCGKTFVQKEHWASDVLFGKCTDVDDFARKSMAVQAETLKTECEAARSKDFPVGGFMNWMYSDIWPTATWALVDYYLQPKHAYYTLKKCYRPVHMAYALRKNGALKLFIINNGHKNLKGTLVFGEKRLNGEVVWQKSVSAECKIDEKFSTSDIENKVSGNDSYLFAYFKDLSTVYFPQLWRSVPFEKKIVYTISPVVSDGKLWITEINLKAESFARIVSVEFNNGQTFWCDDNYFDLEAGETKVIKVYSEKPFTENNIMLECFDKKE